MTKNAPGLTVVALGGNALLRKGERGTAAEQRANLADTFTALEPDPSGRPGRDHARERAAGRKRAAAPGAGRRRGAPAAALRRRRADAGRDRRARRLGAPPDRRAARPSCCSRACAWPRTIPPSRTRPSRSGRSTTRPQAKELEKRPRLGDEGGRRPGLAPRRRLAEAARDPGAGEHQRARRHRRVGVRGRRRRHPGRGAGKPPRRHRRRDRQGSRLGAPRHRARRDEAPDRHAGGRRLPRLRHGRGGAVRRRCARQGRRPARRSARRLDAP